jgi:uncharacterized protein YdhG (YjbR/CyaY superfamily)
MSYGVPAFIQGKSVAGYAAGASHCSFYPMSGAVIRALQAELKGCETSKAQSALHEPTAAARCSGW